MTIPGTTPSADAKLDARTRLREAALDRFGRKGVGRTSTREIIAASGMRNPSAINYHFGTKDELVEDLMREVNVERSAIIRRQVALARQASPPTIEEWAGAAVDAATGLLATERGCLLISVWADQDEANPDAVEQFLRGHHPLARAWRVRSTS
ncbi:MAG: TetR/AcrR family transcriptional regulator [Acidimicrobiia bacterium]